MKYRAIIFDLGGTLSRSAPWSVYREMARKMAAVCSAPTDEFVEKWFSESSGLGTGEYKSFNEYISHICKLLRLEVPENLINLAGKMPVSVDREYVIKPREDALEVLPYLKTNGYKIGLISDCAPGLPELWPESLFAPHFDVTVFSCVEGMNKANPAIFRIALKKLGVEPEYCIYVADGMRNELANAEKLGMKSLQLFVPEEREDSPIRENWQGPKINSLKEILECV
ncbi:MAG: HAD family hydrolase, partial [Croceibacterium sp.]